MDVAMHRSMRGWAQHARSMGLSMPQFSILMQLHYRGQCGVSELSERFGVSMAAASQHVENLVQAGLLERLETPQDRRVRVIQLSPSGRQLIEGGLARRHAWIDQVVAGFGEDDCRRIAGALADLTEATRHLDRSEDPEPSRNPNSTAE